MSELELSILASLAKITDGAKVENTPKFKMDIDEIYENVVGSHGLWQTFIVLLVCISTTAAITFPIFANAVPKHRCKLDDHTEAIFKNMKFNVTSDVMNVSQRLLSFNEISSIIGPWSVDLNDENLHNSIYGCQRYSMNFSESYIKLLMSGVTKPEETMQTESCLNGYVYEPWAHQFPDTIVAEWDLVCDNAWKGPFSTSIYMVGMMVGFIIGGFVGDQMGRRKTVYLATLVEFSFGIAVSFSPNYLSYTIFRALLSAACTTKVTSISVLLVEMTTAKYRSVFSAGWSIYVNFLSRCLTAVLAIYINKWRYLHVVAMTPACIGVIALIFLPESPRWLMSREKYRQATSTLFRAYKVNKLLSREKQNILSKTQFNDVLMYENFEEQSLTWAEKRDLLIRSLKSGCGLEIISNFISAIIRPYATRDLAKTSIISAGIFSCQLCCFFGLLYYARIVRGSVYLVSIINSTTALPATLISTIVYNKIRSRKKPLMILYALSSLTLLTGGLYTTICQPESELSLIVCCNIALVMLGASFNMVFIYVPELYPSILRTQGLGYASGLGRVGSIICSFINQLDLDVRHGLPIVIYGGILLIQLVFVFCASDGQGESLDDRFQTDELNLIE